MGVEARPGRRSGADWTGRKEREGAIACLPHTASLVPGEKGLEGRPSGL